MNHLEHQCIVKNGPAEGNTAKTKVSYTDILYNNRCDNCGELLAPHQEVLAHLYYVIAEDGGS